MKTSSGLILSRSEGPKERDTRRFTCQTERRERARPDCDGPDVGDQTLLLVAVRFRGGAKRLAAGVHPLRPNIGWSRIGAVISALRILDADEATAYVQWTPTIQWIFSLNRRTAAELSKWLLIQIKEWTHAALSDICHQFLPLLRELVPYLSG